MLAARFPYLRGPGAGSLNGVSESLSLDNPGPRKPFYMTPASGGDGAQHPNNTRSRGRGEARKPSVGSGIACLSKNPHTLWGVPGDPAIGCYEG